MSLVPYTVAAGLFMPVLLLTFDVLENPWFVVGEESDLLGGVNTLPAEPDI